MATSSANRTNGSLLESMKQVTSARRVLLLYFVCITIYVYTPIISLIVFSFNSGGLTFPFTDITTDWYTQLFSNTAIIESIIRSLMLASVVTVITTVLGTAAALAYRYDFRGRQLVLYLLILGIITPGITYGVGAMLLQVELLGFEKGLWLAVPVHVVWTLPFAVIVLLAGFPPTLAENEQAASVLGAGRWTTIREVILPQIAPTILGAAVFAFTLSYNEGTRSILLLGSDTTMPLQVFSIAGSQRPTPMLFALGSVTTLVSTLLLAVGGYLVLKGSQTN
ncbi:ABC transporter permease [Haloarcula litorea]|uniref:ABC transporter permease n=1 Tax=Haloarcula litorea TaxID=3032579 RepID=UPI0023E7CA1A|nr:ABC transporter permease [Halomicroarcula sp. GDY20]